jgi:hypothetical protein
LKDIDNSKLLHVETALQRLDKALTRLEGAASKAATAVPAASNAGALAEKLHTLTAAHDSLKETAGRVALRLDTAIGRLSASLDSEA